MTTRAERRPRPLFALLKGFCLLALVGIFSAEISLRVFNDQSSSLYVGRAKSKVHDPVSIERNKPFYRYRSGITTNELGFLAPRDLRFEKPPGELRLLYLGDSVTHSPVDVSYPLQVERLLEEAGLQIQTVNTSVAGFAAENVLALLESEVVKFEGDFLFVLIGWNNIGQYGPDGFAYKRQRAGYEISPVQKVLALFYFPRLFYGLERLVRDRFLPTVNRPLDERERRRYESFHPAYYERSLRRIAEIAKSRYERVYLLTLPSVTSLDAAPEDMAKIHFPAGMEKNVRRLHILAETYNSVIEDVAASEGVGLIDVHALFDSPEGRERFTAVSHVDAEGHRRIAERLAGEIQAALP